MFGLFIPGIFLLTSLAVCQRGLCVFKLLLTYQARWGILLNDWKGCYTTRIRYLTEQDWIRTYCIDFFYFLIFNFYFFFNSVSGTQAPWNTPKWHWMLGPTHVTKRTERGVFECIPPPCEGFIAGSPLEWHWTGAILCSGSRISCPLFSPVISFSDPLMRFSGGHRSSCEPSSNHQDVFSLT